MWSDVPKVIQNNKLDFLHKGRLQQKQAVAGGGFPKFWLETKIFLPATDSHDHEL